MEPILQAAKSFNGIQVTYLSSNDEAVSELFSYENLIDMKINVADLLDNPDRYAFDTNGPAVVRTDFCNPELHDECRQ